MPDVSSTAPADVRLWVALDVHKLSIVAAILPPAGGAPEVGQIETTRAAIRRFIATPLNRLGIRLRPSHDPTMLAAFCWSCLTPMLPMCDMVAHQRLAQSGEGSAGWHQHRADRAEAHGISNCPRDPTLWLSGPDP